MKNSQNLNQNNIVLSNKFFLCDYVRFPSNICPFSCHLWQQGNKRNPASFSPEISPSSRQPGFCISFRMSWVSPRNSSELIMPAPKGRIELAEPQRAPLSVDGQWFNLEFMSDCRVLQLGTKRKSPAGFLFLFLQAQSLGHYPDFVGLLYSN